MERTRRQFMKESAVAAAALAIGAEARPVVAQSSAAAAAVPSNAPIDLAEWSYFWVGVERAPLARGTVVNGAQMYVEYLVPATIRHPYSIVLEHGGGGQGLDWMETPDGRRGWWTYFVEQGFKVYVIDRPGHGRSPFHPDLQGPFPQRATAIEGMERQFTAPEKAQNPYGPQATLHTQWPGTGQAGDPTEDQAACGQGGSFLADLERTHAIWQQRAAELLDKIGPAIIFTHSMGGPFGWLAGDIRPNLVKGIVGVEPAGPPFGNLKWGVTASRLTYEPLVHDPSELKTVEWIGPMGDKYQIQAEPARKLKNLAGIPIALVTSEASYHVPYDPATVAFLKQAGCAIDHLKLPELGIKGNAHFMMMEKNNRAVLQPILDWIDKHASPKSVQPTSQKRLAPAIARSPNEAAVTLADHGHFWLTEEKKMPYGTIEDGQMYVQFLTPAAIRHQTPVVLVHGGTGQMLHYMGNGDGLAGWAHYYVQEGYRVFLVDRPGHGRAPYHPDSLGPIGAQPTYEMVAPEFSRAAGSGGQWPGSGAIGDPLVDQFMASQNAALQDDALARKFWAARGAQLLDRIGPAIVQTHSAGGPFGWLVANQRPSMVKAIVCVEGATMPVFTDADRERMLAGLRAIPVAIVTAERSGRTSGPVVDFFRKGGVAADDLQLKDAGIHGNGHFMMLENNRRQVFDAIRGWIEKKVSV